MPVISAKGGGLCLKLYESLLAPKKANFKLLYCAVLSELYPANPVYFPVWKRKVISLTTAGDIGPKEGICVFIVFTDKHVKIRILNCACEVQM